MDYGSPFECAGCENTFNWQEPRWKHPEQEAWYCGGCVANGMQLLGVKGSMKWEHRVDSRMNALHHRLTALEKESYWQVKDLSKRLWKLEKTIEQLDKHKNRMDRHEGRINEHIDRLEKQDADINFIKARIQALETKLDDHEDRLNWQREWLKQNDEKIQSLISRLDAMESAMGDVVRLKAEGLEVEDIKKEAREEYRREMKKKVEDRIDNTCTFEFLRGLKVALKFIDEMEDSK